MGYFDDPSSVVGDWLLTVNTVRPTVACCMLPEGDEVLAHNRVFSNSSGKRSDGVKVSVLLSFSLSFSVASTRSVMVELPPVLQ